MTVPFLVHVSSRETICYSAPLHGPPDSAREPGTRFDRDPEVEIVSNTPAVGERPGKALVLLANEPRAYRESIAQVFGQLRPNVEVITAQPDELEERILRHGPAMVVCSEATAVVRERVPFWIELYPGYGSRSVVSLEGARSTIEEIQLSDLLAVLDRAEGLAQRG